MAYTGFFKNDELIDTEHTIAASAKIAAELDDEEAAAALQGTELPKEADSLVDQASVTLTHLDENDLLEPVRDPEPTIVLDEAPEPEKKSWQLSRPTLSQSPNLSTGPNQTRKKTITPAM